MRRINVTQRHLYFIIINIVNEVNVGNISSVGREDVYSAKCIWISLICGVIIVLLVVLGTVLGDAFYGCSQGQANHHSVIKEVMENATHHDSSITLILK